MTDSIVLVTGASGYIAGHVVKLLLENGYRVRGTVRSLKDEEKVKHLQEICPQARHNLELVEADLLDAGCWKEAVKGCVAIQHVASPVPMYSPKNEDDIIKPALEGTLNVLRAAAEAGTVKRVVLTSSLIAVTTLSGNTVAFTEKDWPEDRRSNSTYANSKIRAERAAWKFVENLPDGQKFDLAVVNPGMVTGPPLNSAPSASLEIVKQLLERKMPAIPSLNFPIVDVRDVALAHIKCMTLDEAVGNRHILVTRHMWMSEVAQILDKEFRSQGYNVPTRTLPGFLMTIAGWFNSDVKFARQISGQEMQIDTSRMRNVLQISPTDTTKSYLDMAYAMIENGIVKKTRQFKGPCDILKNSVQEQIHKSSSLEAVLCAEFLHLGMSDPIVLVTGASGYLASHVVRLLLENNYRVRGTIRTLTDEAKVKRLRELCPSSNPRLQLVEADLLDLGSWKEAVKGCTFIHHMASPVPIFSPKKEDEIVKPAVQGTFNVLQAAAESGTIRRVVLTSSLCAVSTYGGNTTPVTERDWSAETRNLMPYIKSKIRAEKVAWDFMKKLPDDQKFELAVVNPGMVSGPPLHGTSSSTVHMIKQMLEHEMSAVPPLCFPVIDVRDVALAHLRCMNLDAAAGSRHILVSRSIWAREIAELLDQEFKSQGYNVPRKEIPGFVMTISGWFNSAVRSFRQISGQEMLIDTSRMRKVLGINPIDLKKSYLDMAYGMIENGLVQKTQKFKDRNKSS